MSASTQIICDRCNGSRRSCVCNDNSAWRELAPARCSPVGRPTFPVTMDKDEFQAIENLAWMVKHSRQNVGLRMLDAAESVIKILKSKKPENESSSATR